MCSMKSQPLWEETLEATLPLAGTLVAFIGMFIVLFTVVS
jgi:hypothetical protein